MEQVKTVAADEGDGAGTLSGLQVIVGLFAGLAAVIYLTGGATLGLRLLWAGLPTLPVGQLPREFLFSLGAAQVVLPALAVGLVVGFLELGQDLRRLKKGHLRWSEAKQITAVRRAYIAFYATIPFVLIIPGTAIASGTDDRIENKWTVLTVLGVIALISLLVWIRFVRRAKLEDRGPPQTEPHDDLGFVAWSAILVPGLLLSLALGGWMWWMTDHDLRYFGTVGAWAVAVFFALLTVWLRSRAGEKTRKELPDADPDSDANKRADVSPGLVVVSWCATAVLAVPVFMGVTAAWPLTGAVVCAQQVKDRPYVVAGKFVGETKDRVYIGDDKNRRLISVPAANVSRLLVGSDAANRKACKRSKDVDSAPK
jgi:hypothetical protein